MHLSRSENLFQKAKTIIPGGVNSPVRAFKAVSGIPLFVNKALGPYLYDSENKKYITKAVSALHKEFNLDNQK